MNHPVLKSVIAFVNIAAIGLFMVHFYNMTYPMIGHDFSYFLPRVVDTHLHYKTNGMSIQWYTPSFGGGLPAYPNPQHIQFSLPQLLTWLVNPWWAILASTVVFIAIGFGATYYFLKRILGLHWMASMLGALFFSANGFYFEHMVVGHLSFQAFPILAVLFVALFHPALPSLPAGMLISVVGAVLVYSAGFYIAVAIGISLLLTLPLLYLYQPALFSWRRFFSTAGWGTLLTVLLCGSKVWAVYSFMRFFPRLISNDYQVDWLQGFAGLLLQLLGAMTLAPIYWLSNKNLADLPAVFQKATGADFGIWEIDVAVSPVIWLLLLGGGIAFLTSKKLRQQVNGAAAKWIALALLLATVGVAVEFILAKGTVYLHLRQLLFLRSLHANVRYASAFIFPLAALGAVIFHQWTKNWASPARALAIFSLFNALTLAAMSFYLLLPLEVYALEFNVSPLIAAYDVIEKKGEIYPVDKIKLVSDAEAFQQRASSLRPYESIFGYKLPQFHPAIRPGEVWETSEGYFNINDPTGYVYPEANHSAVFARIRESDRDKLSDFVQRRQPNWNLPVSQRIWNGLSLLTLAFEFVMAGIFLARTRARRRNQAPTPTNAEKKLENFL